MGAFLATAAVARLEATQVSPVRNAVAPSGTRRIWREEALQSLFPTRAFRSFDQVGPGGLPQHSINAMAQDEEGALWIATFDGVASFDGTEMRVVASAPHAPHSGSYYALARRHGGGVYAGGSDGVHVYDGLSWDLWPTPRAVASLAEGRALWIVDQSGELWRRDLGSSFGWTARRLPDSMKPAVAVAAGADGAVWIAGRGGLARIDAAGEEGVVDAGAVPAPVSAFLVAGSGLCWVGTVAGEIYFARPGATAWTKAANPGWRGGRVLVLAEDRKGRIWAGGRGGRVCFGGEAGPWTTWGPENGLKTSSVTSILADREGTVWFGFVTDGLQQWLGEGWSHRTESSRLVVPGITGTADGGFLAAVFSRGIWRWDGTLHAYGPESGLTEDARFAVEPRPGVLWVGARFGIFESQRGGPFRRTLELPSGLVTGLFRAPDGAWYAASSTEGIFSLGPSGWRPESALNAALPDLNVRGMTWLQNGHLWVATFRGVTVFKEGRAETLRPDPSTGVPRSAHVVFEVGDGEVWVGAFGGIGVWREGRWRVLTETDGLPGHTTYSLKRAPDGSIWAGGSAGVGRFADGQWTVYDSHSGLIDGECNVNALWIAPDGSVLVGTMGSLARFDPRVAPPPAPGLRVFWREAPRRGLGGIARLPPHQRSLRLAWSVPWLLPAALEYRTRVPRLGPGWSEPQRGRQLMIENLGPGRWDVEVSARLEGKGPEGWSEPAVLRLFIEPHVWETAWARATLALLAGLGIAALVRLRTLRLARRASELQQGIEKALAEVKVLSGLLPICAWCKKVRDDKGYWSQIEAYLKEHSSAEFTHGICPGCEESTRRSWRVPRGPGGEG